ncbi:helix-turn-helix domain-containing protein [Haloferax sp. DFSO60]|uniref:helix-turn-helix domain-containing protein n=1 Tax=Haloferax sp. DFSO60 TaxID=3388652 RepID=UPI00397D757D
MKCLDLRITHTPETIHPVHEFEITHPAFHGSELRYWNPSLGERNSMIFKVWGDPAAYDELLTDREEAVSHSIAPTGENVFYCWVCERLTDRDESYIDALSSHPVVVVPPVHYNQDRTVDVTLVGSAMAVEHVFERLPSDAPIEVRAIANYQTRIPGAVGVLTDRQREAVAVAVELGYYESPRQGTVSEVAAHLGVSKSTAAEHLRKAEATTMRQALQWE